MTASLYQSGSFHQSTSVVGCVSAVASWSIERWVGRLEEVVEVALGMHAPPDAEDVRRAHLRVQLAVVPRGAPEIARAGEQIVRLEALSGVDTQLIELQRDPARLPVMRVKVHYRE